MSDWTIKSALEWTQGYLADKGDENPRLSAQWLLSEATGLSRTHLFVNFDRPLSEEERGVLRDFVRRRGAGEPLQYITGEVAFRHITVKVLPGVLIPRPETEVLVSEVLAALPAAGKREARWNPEAAEQEREAVEAVKKALEEAGFASGGSLAGAGGLKPAPVEGAGEVGGGLGAAPVEGAAAERRGSFDSDLAVSAQDDTTGSDDGVSVPDTTPSERHALHVTPSEQSAPDVVPSERSTPCVGPREGGTSCVIPSERSVPCVIPSERSESRDLPAPLLVADLCTGSGCIACSLAFEHPDVRVIATDIAPEAVALARENIEALDLGERVAVLQCSLGSGIGEKRLGTFDAVVSNPPYVPTEVMAALPAEVADFEPALALDGGADGLDLFRPLAAWAARALKPGGVLACELHEGHMEAARSVAEAAGFTELRIVDDLAGRPRVLVGRKPIAR